MNIGDIKYIAYLDDIKELEGKLDGEFDNIINEMENIVENIPDVFHDVPQSSVTEDMTPSDFDYGLTLCGHGDVGNFPSINDYGVSLTLRGKNISYAQIFITRYGDIWSRRSSIIDEWNGEWYSVAKEIDKKADIKDLQKIDTKLENKASLEITGDLKNLSTENKSNLVGAINEIKDDFIVSQREPTIDDASYKVGQRWYSKKTRNIYVLNNIDEDGATWDSFIRDRSISPKQIYGFEIDESNSNPETAVTYIGENTDFIPAEESHLGTWGEIVKDLVTPVLLKGGEVQYELQHDDRTKKRDGSDANLTGADGDVMIRFKHIWVREDKISNKKRRVWLSDTEFEGAVSYTKMTERGYNQLSWGLLMTLQHLYLLLYKNRDSQTALGLGYVSGNSEATNTGGANTKPFCFGETSGKQQVVFLGIEDFWGNKFQYIDGIVTDDNHNLKIGYNNFNDDGLNYKLIRTHLPEYYSGYFKTTMGGEAGYILADNGDGSSSTGYCDYSQLNRGKVVVFGGYYKDNYQSGAFHTMLNGWSSTPYLICGARLCFVDDDYFYVGAYLGYIQNRKLRSISGRRPSEDKTISAFREYAQANN